MGEAKDSQAKADHFSRRQEADCSSSESKVGECEERRSLRIVHQSIQAVINGESRTKDDRLDARTLARLARIDPQLLAPAKHRSAKAQADDYDSNHMR